MVIVNTCEEKGQDMPGIDERYKSIVIGLGKTGQSIVDYYMSRGRPLLAMDSGLDEQQAEQLRQKYPDLPLSLGEFDEGLLSGAEEILISPGVPLSTPAIQAALARGVRVTSDVEIFCQEISSPVLAVTGSNGKSTVATLLAQMIEDAGHKVALAGNIGLPVLQLLSEDEPDFYVLELSSFQLEILQSLNARAAVVLNVSEDHMDRYASFEDYCKAKHQVYRGDGTMVINLDDASVRDMLERDRLVTGFTLSRPGEESLGIVAEDNQHYICLGTEKLLDVSLLRVKGAHNVANCLAALAMGRVIELPMQSMLATLRNFKGLPHRCQWLAKVDGVDWYNDSKGTNVGATCAAIKGLEGPGKMVLIAGGDGKGADFSGLKDVVRERVSSVILIGRDARRLEQVLSGVCDCFFALDMKSAVKTAAGITRAGDRVLLSPACASQDMFRDYQHRGEEFTSAVNSLEGNDDA